MHSDIDGYIDVSLCKKIEGNLCGYVSVLEKNPKIIDQNHKKVYVTVFFEDILDGRALKWELSELLLSYNPAKQVMCIGYPLCYV